MSLSGMAVCKPCLEQLTSFSFFVSQTCMFQGNCWVDESYAHVRVVRIKVRTTIGYLFVFSIPQTRIMRMEVDLHQLHNLGKAKITSKTNSNNNRDS